MPIFRITEERTFVAEVMAPDEETALSHIDNPVIMWTQIDAHNPEAECIENCFGDYEEVYE